jgi:hypothetical protein
MAIDGYRFAQPIRDVDAKDPDIALLIRATLDTPAHKFSAHSA